MQTTSLLFVGLLVLMSYTSETTASSSTASSSSATGSTDAGSGSGMSTTADPKNGGNALGLTSVVMTLIPLTLSLALKHFH
ncbi:hypothetical protein V1264_013189 [Littorina saxatilis]|uniref:Uncharacterized protein n=1 Tax=Littorina saxatilis TaxID=31220 RepID=A0AAN9BPY9_9CAEN